MQSGMSVHDSIALMGMHIPGISLSLFVSWLHLDSQSAISSYGPGLYTILVLYSCIVVVFEPCVIGLHHLFLNVATSSLWSVIMLPSWANSSCEIFLGHVI